MVEIVLLVVLSFLLIYLFYKLLIYIDFKVTLYKNKNTSFNINKFDLEDKLKTSTIIHYKDNKIIRFKKKFYKTIDKYILISNINHKISIFYTVKVHIFMSILAGIIFFTLSINLPLFIRLLVSLLSVVLPTILLGAYSYRVIFSIRESLPAHLEQWAYSIDKSENYLAALDVVIEGFPKDLKYYFKDFLLNLRSGNVVEGYDTLIDIFYLIPEVQTMFGVLELHHNSGGNVKSTLLIFSELIATAIEVENEAYKKLRMLKSTQIFLVFLGLYGLYTSNISVDTMILTHVNTFSIKAIIDFIRIISISVMVYLTYDSYNFFLRPRRM